MKYSCILLLIFIPTCFFGQNQEKHLFQIYENGKIGFIDSTGKVVIEPKFLSAGEFSESLASARIAGRYGFIDQTGKFIIQPDFDYATKFNEGFAVVYMNDKPFYINMNGQKTFEIDFPFIDNFENGRALVVTKTKKLGYIDKKGKLLTTDNKYFLLS